MAFSFIWAFLVLFGFLGGRGGGLLVGVFFFFGAGGDVWRFVGFLVC